MAVARTPRFTISTAACCCMQGELVASTESFEQAKTAIDALLAVSVSEQAGALAINDAQRSYVGEPFERAFLHVYAALNFLELGSPDEARVEMLQLDVLLGDLERDGELAGTALPRYFAGLVFESRGEWSGRDDCLSQGLRGLPRPSAGLRGRRAVHSVAI